MMNILANSSERSFLCSVREMSNPQASLCSSSRCFPLIETSVYTCPRVVTYCLAISVLAAFCVTTQLLLLLSEHTCHILRLSCPSLCFSLKEGEDQKEIKIEPADAVEEVEPLPEDYYTRPINLTEGNALIFCHFLPLYFIIWAVPGNLAVGFLMAWGFSNFYAGIRIVENVWLFKW